MTRTNVVVVVMDTTRSDVVFERAGSREKTPELASMADEGVTFDRAFAPAPWTLPSHASMFTGTYPSKHGAHANRKRLDDRLATLPATLQRAGYETVAVSNNTWISEEFGFGRGFETFHKTWQYVQTETDLGRIAREHEGRDKFVSLARSMFDGNPLVNALNAFYGQFLRKQSDSGSRRSTDWIRNWLATRGEDRPFFLFVNYLEPHLEYRPPRRYAEPFLPDGLSYDEAMEVPQDAWSYVAGKIDMSEADFDALRALYRGEVACLDDRIGDLRDALVAAGEWEDTVLVVTSDHGENIGDHGLMDHQYCLYDTVLSVPLVIRGGPFDGGGVDESFAQLVDIPDTLLDVAGIGDSRLETQSQGRSLHPDTPGARDHVLAEYMAPQPSMAALENHVGSLPDDVYRFDRSLRAIRTADRKLVRGSDETTRLYALDDDDPETSDRSAAEPGRVAELEARLDDWLSSFESAEATDDVSISDDAESRLERLGYLQ